MVSGSGGRGFDFFERAMFDFFLRAGAPPTAEPALQSLKKFTGRPGTSTRIENTQPESGQVCSSSSGRL